MNTKSGGTSKPASETNALERAMQIALAGERRRKRMEYRAWMSAGALALVAAVIGLESCGSESGSRSAVTSSSATQEAVVASTESSAGAPTVTAESLQRPVEYSSDLHALPPDMVPAVSDTFVTAGQPVEVTVEGTPDITEMALSDGRGDSLPMVRDSVGNVWRVDYRVPLRPKQSRIGLSVTAKNEQHRWRRVWLFLSVDDGKQSVEPQIQSGDTQ